MASNLFLREAQAFQRATIKRFSEDLDFKVVNARNLNESQRRDIRHAFIDILRQIPQFKIDDEKIKTRNKGRDTNFEVEYPKQFTTPDFLRPFVQVEVFFDDEDLSFETKQISSLVNEYIKEPAETEINCILPFNTAADKFNALAWRIHDKSVDYTLLRHLHDIYALKTYITDENAFKTRVLHNFASKDKPRLKDVSITFSDILSQTNQILSEDKAFRNGYNKYVASMSYASKEEQPSFEDTLAFFQELSKLF